MMHSSGAARPLSFDPARDVTPVLASAGTRWSGPPVEVHALGPAEYAGPSGPLDGECGVFVVLDGQLEIVVRKGPRDVVRRVAAGYTSFMSGSDRRTVVRVSGRARAAAVHVPVEWFERLSFRGVPPRFGRTRPLLGDETVRALTAAVCDEIARGAPTGRLYGESVSMALLSYVLRHVSPAADDGGRRALSDAECRRVRDLVRARLAEDLSVEDLASCLGIGPRHFTRLFRRAFETTPYRYLLGERLAEAARLLERSGLDVAEVALRVGFSSQSHLSTAFRKHFGRPPARYRVERRGSRAGH
jgi:AraC-like DNA-binding protein